MISDEEIERVLLLKKAYTKLGVYDQQRINMFDYIKQHWNDRLQNIHDEIN